MALPETMTDLQAGRLWKQDRVEKAECKARHGALAASVKVVE